MDIAKDMQSECGECKGCADVAKVWQRVQRNCEALAKDAELVRTNAKVAQSQKCAGTIGNVSETIYKAFQRNINNRGVICKEGE